ncbi:S-type pyocin domain-containing protein [Pseudomonas sp. MH2]|uniref:S-type pyocin domain-containing protein n=1 Tax=Pseudomonas machongensis TaxID=3110229 RepID=A0ABU5VI36_9PSED|nr:S-type pyocin domain-containing protein [Pseudomonas sp. MH2]MEA5672140.1 S-type pyocin domain-containing protein [Pseudomonas sp. MH2]
MTQGPVYHLEEGLWITDTAPERVPLTPIPGGLGGGGPGYGGWGLSDAPPRGTGAIKNHIRHELAWRRIFGEEQANSLAHYANEFSPLIQQLPARIEAQRTEIAQQAAATADDSKSVLTRHQNLTTSIVQENRARYLQKLPKALGFFGAMPLYKRNDSFMSRLNDPGVFEITGTAEAWGNLLWETYNSALESAYELHLEAEIINALASDLPALALALDQAEEPVTSTARTDVISRRAAQIKAEQKICFDCLPNFLQHELVAATPEDSGVSVSQTLSTHASIALQIVATRQANSSGFTQTNPEINSPLSKPQLEALQHLVGEQATGRAGPLWLDYHKALANSESIRYLQAFATAYANLVQRAQVVEQLQADQAAHDEAQKAERLKQEQERQRISYTATIGASIAIPSITPIGNSSFALAEAGYLAMQLAIRAAIAGPTALAAPAVVVGLVTLLWPSTLANSERRYLVSVPLADLTPTEGPDLVAMAAGAQALDLPYILSGIELQDELTLYVAPGGKPVPVKAATFDPARGTYSLALDEPHRILTWTPSEAPGAESGGSTSLPSLPPGTVIYPGSKLDPIQNEQPGYPGLDQLDQERLIVTFPAESGLPPILVVFKSPRYEPGIVTGSGVPTSGLWLGEITRTEGALIPSHIADLLRGREYKNFDAFRVDFWKAVANDPVLSKQFSKQNLIRMLEKGNAPTVRRGDEHGLQKSFSLHHVTPISEGGAVYDIDNIRVVTPAAHNKIHYGDNQ